jgi:thioredoxin-like negative regulator of GroEL
VNKPALIGIVGILLCALAIWESARIGFARTYAIRALTSNGVITAEASVRKLPNDAEVHAARGIVLQRTDDYAEGCRELERAVQLRPRDYFLWMMLGVTRDLNDDQQGALTALQEAVALAPSYAKPRWLIGNLLLRMNKTEEGFEQLRAAAEADPALLPNVIDLAWGFSHNDAARTVALVGPQTDAARLPLAVYLAGHKEGSAALDQFRRMKSRAGPEFDQLTQRLIDARSYDEAFAVWTATRCPSCKPGSLRNADFEEDIAMPAQGFAWQITNASPNVTLSIDTSEHESGMRSLRIDFHGESDAARPLISQFVLVSPGMRYRLNFQSMTRAFVSAAMPVVRIVDASNGDDAVLGQSSNLMDASSWRGFTVDFTTNGNTHAVQIIASRPACPVTNCAAFGTVWLDSFTLDPISNNTGK